MPLSKIIGRVESLKYPKREVCPKFPQEVNWCLGPSVQPKFQEDRALPLQDSCLVEGNRRDHHSIGAGGKPKRVADRGQNDMSLVHDKIFSKDYISTVTEYLKWGNTQ